MYLHLGQSVMIPSESVIGIFDMDNTSWSFRTRLFLEKAEEEGLVMEVGDDLPRAFVLCQKIGQPATVYTTSLNSAALIRRSQSGGSFDSI
ncbi:MAG: DUF370 domain-containing protein [Oscillospiraceae bacterium]|nr:DUF370 domain-containing protein [Oscillospiraceae bacterium]